MKKLLFWILGILIILILGFYLYVNVSWEKDYSDVPLPDLKATNDSTLIARGEYLVYGPAHCATCHVPIDRVRDVGEGVKTPLSGGWELSIPPGTVRAPNLTPDMETGIGSWSDGQIARALRYSVSHDGRFLMPFMPFQELSDEDVVAIISYLRSQPPVKHKVERTEYTFLGKTLLALGAIEPIGPKNAPPVSVKIDSSIAYGKYLAHSVADCVGCHTERDLRSGAFIGPEFAGGMIFEPDVYSQGYAFVSPNITPDLTTGVMAKWDETMFIERFRSGRIHQGSPMPWGATANMTDTDLKALYRYLMSLKPVHNEINKIVYNPGEALP